MPTVKNISPKGDLELVLHQVDSEPDEDGNVTVLRRQRIVFVDAGKTVELTAEEAKLLDDTNWLVLPAPKKSTRARGGVVKAKPGGTDVILGNDKPETVIPLGTTTEPTGEAAK